MLAKLRLLVAVAWAGSLWAVGYLVAPTLFATLSDRVLAGTIAGAMFHVEAMLSLGCALALMVLLQVGTPDWTPRRRRTVLALIAAMALCTVVSHFGLQPMMAELRAAAGPAGVMESAAKSRFGMLHGAASVLYLVQSLLAGWLILKQ
jgi:MFS family permease